MTAVKKRKSVKKRRKSISLDKKKARAGWLFVLPFIIGLILIYLPIVIDSLNYSFTKIVPLPPSKGGGYRLDPVGLKHYHAALTEDARFTEILVSGIKDLVFDIPAIVIFSLFIAVLLNKKILGRAAFRAIFFIPVLLTTGLIASIDASNTLGDYMDSTGEGIDTGASSNGAAEIVSATDLQSLFPGMVVGGELATYVTTVVNNIFDIVNRSGVQMLIFLAALQGISPSIYESCQIEGCSAWETFWKITLPMISPMILVNAVYTIIDSFTSENNEVMSYVNAMYNQAGDGNVISSAMAWMYFLIVIAIVALAAGIVSTFVFYQKKD